MFETELNQLGIARKTGAEPSQKSGRKPGLAVALVTLSMLIPLTACDRVQVSWPGARNDTGRNGYSCPRPPEMSRMQGFNGQEREIRRFRRLAFGNDFFAQLELANRYAARNDTDKNIQDPIESSVWLVMALANPNGYDLTNASDNRKGIMTSSYDKCRANERARAYVMLDDQLSRMDQGERDKVRDRVIYIMSTFGAEGFMTLGRLYDGAYGPMGEPANNIEAQRATMKGNQYARPFVLLLFERADVDAYLYYYKARATGDMSSYAMLQTFEHSSREHKALADSVASKSLKWVAPYEFYPPEAPSGGVPHSDQSIQSDDSQQAAARIDDLPFVHVARALVYLDMATTEPASPAEVSKQTLDALRQSLGMPAGERMTAYDKIRAIQMAAVNGDSRSQLVLAVMYSEGVGVSTDFARAFYWYSQAEKQGSPQAKFAMSSYFDLGLAGVADQNKAEAVVLQLDAALGGFKPSANRLQAILAQVSGAPER